MSKENNDDGDVDDSNNNKNMYLHVWITISQQGHSGHRVKVKNVIGDVLVKYNVARGHRIKAKVSDWSRTMSTESASLKEYGQEMWTLYREQTSHWVSESGSQPASPSVRSPVRSSDFSSVSVSSDRRKRENTYLEKLNLIFWSRIHLKYLEIVVHCITIWSWYWLYILHRI